MIPLVTEAALGLVAHAVFEHLAKQGVEMALPEGRLRAWLGRDPQRLAFQIALARALATFATHYPEWAATFFDQPFLAGPAAPLLARCLTAQGAPDPPELAAAWADQFGVKGTARERQITEITPAAADFLRWLEAELRNREEFRPLYDSRDLDAIRESAAATTEAVQALRADLAAALGEARTTFEVRVEQAPGQVIGDYARVTNIFQTFAAAAPPIATRIRTAEFRTLVDERTRDFVGREFVFRAIDQLLHDPHFPSGYVVIRGEPGIGKTALMAQLVKQREWVHHFNVRSQNIRSAQDFLENVCAQLIAGFGLEHAKLAPEAARDSGILSQLLAEAAGAAGQRLVVLVDALDEAEDPGTPGANRLYLPPALPDGVYFVVTTREKDAYQLKVDRLKPIPLRDDDPRNLADVRRYVEDFIGKHREQMTARIAKWGVKEDEFIDVLVNDKSQGNFMYLVHVLADVRDGNLTRDNVDSVYDLPAGLRAYYDTHWEIMRQQDPERFENLYEPIVCTLAVVREPVTVAQVMTWTKRIVQVDLTPMRVREVIAEWHQFLNEGKSKTGEPVYRVYHTSFQDFLEEKVGLVGYHNVIIDTALAKIPGFLPPQ